MENQMLCYQCESTADGKGCNSMIGVCGKTAETSRLQDELTGALVGLAKASIHKSIDEEIQWLLVEGLCATAAHTNFDDTMLQAMTIRVQAAKKKYIPKFGDYNTSLKIPEDFDIRMIWQKSPDIRSLKSLLLFGIRGIATYAYQSWVLGHKNKEAATFFHKALIALGANHFKEDYFDLLNEMGDVNLRAMELLIKANNSVYGQPSPVDVPRLIEPGPFIIVSGHNYKDLEMILDQTEGTGINVYSHCEMLPAHAYPKFRQYRHFKGHYGSGWQNQQVEFDNIPAAIVFTTNCIMTPLASYADRVFTTGISGLPGVPHIDNGDFRPVLIRAIELGGAPSALTFPGINGGDTVKTGFGKKSLLTLGYKVAGAMADGDINHIFVIGGCDGMGEDRAFFTDIVHRIPADSVVLTYGCCKFRFNDMENKEIGGVPKFVDIGQCGDLLNVVEAVAAIASSAQCRVEELPLTWLLSWQEQRSIANLFSLFAADVHNVIFGPKLPPFFTASVFDVYAKEFNVSILMREEDETAATEEESAVEDEAFLTPTATESVATAPEPTMAQPLEERATYEEPHDEESVYVEQAHEEPTFYQEKSGDGENSVTANPPSPYTPAELEDRSAEAGLPDWAISDDEDEDESIDAEPIEEVKAPKIRPEDIDQTPAFALAEEDDETSKNKEEALIDEEAELSLFDPKEVKTAAEPPKKQAAPRTASTKGKGGKKKASAASAAAKPRRTKAVAEKQENDITAPPLKMPKGAGVSGAKVTENSLDFDDHQPAQNPPLKERKEMEQPPKLDLPKGKGVSGMKISEDDAEEPQAYVPPKKQSKNKQKAPVPQGNEDEEPVQVMTQPNKAVPPKPSVEPALPQAPTDEETSPPPTPPADAASTEPKLAIPKGKGVSGWHDPDEEPAFTPGTERKPYQYTPRETLKETVAPPPIVLPAGAGVSGFSPRIARDEFTPPVQDLYSFAAPQGEIKIPKGKGVSGWKDSDENPVSKRKQNGNESEEKSKAKPWLEASLKQLKESLAENSEQSQTTAAPLTEPIIETPVVPEPPHLDAEIPVEQHVAEIAATPQEMVTQAAPSNATKPWLEASLKELKASIQADQEGQNKDSSAKPWLAASLKELKASLQETSEPPAAPEAAATTPTKAIVEEDTPAPAGHRPTVQPKSWQDIVPAPVPAAETPTIKRSQPQAQIAPTDEPSGSEPPPETWKKPPVTPKPWQQDLQTTWQKPPVQLRPWEQQQPTLFRGSAEPTQGQGSTAIPNLPLGNNAGTPGYRPAAPNQPMESSPYRYVEREPSPPEIPTGAGVSGYQQAAYMPGQQPGYSVPSQELREVPPPLPVEIPLGAGVSGVRFHPEEPAVVPSYDPTYYDVPQKTPKLNLPKGVGVSGWQNGEGPIDPAEALRQQAAEQNRGQVFTQDDLLAFTNAEGPAGNNNDAVLRPGEGEELIATLGPDGKVILTVRPNQSKNR